MKKFTCGGKFQFTRYVLFFFIILLQACALGPGERIEGSDFEENLPGLWEGSYNIGGSRAKVQIEIIKVEGNEVQLTGLMAGGAEDPETDEVSGRIENAALLLTWPAAADSGCIDKYVMARDSSNNLMLSGNKKCGSYTGDVSLFKKK